MRVDSNEFEQIIRFKSLRFSKAGTITLIKDKYGSLLYSPQLRYKNYHNYAYLENIDETTCFCKFKMDLPDCAGVYLWVVDNEIIYIGEAQNLRKRFNAGYGIISPRNCLKGGQSTNVRMNRVVLSCNQDGQTIDIYICITEDYKNIESYLLDNIKTKFNIQNNR